ncbi:TonB-dependent receptor plug domain-containing protein [Vannielia litorea]|uniref:TonB-dependent receptor plug domain-containing protein n=1 Tax=Vannielia litorea TaxID=1217970 RepID=UPI001C943271|nr:TonB-dependent receptor [Vannielia litorea]MBY6049707.1 TonB-dependent receptor [Vannielia litorea]MBY6077121.1 TonB-dependent receptor [Vannielia litorea]
MNRLLATTAALALSTSALSAQESYDLETITVTADLSDGTETDRTGATVEVSTREELEAAGDDDLATYLSRQPGLSLAASGGPGSLADIRMRGLHQKYVKVQIDGIDVLDPSSPSPSYDFGLMGVSGLGRIEVLKGSQSAQYGSSAVAGVISLQSRRATEEGTHVYLSGEIGSYDSFGLAATVTSLGERHNFAVTLERLEFGGFSSADEEDGNTEADGFSSVRLSFNGEYALTDALSIGLSGFTEKSTVAIDGGFPFGDTAEETDGTSNGLRAFARYDAGAITHQFEATYYDIERDYAVSGNRYEGERHGLRYLGQATLSPSVQLNFGADYTEEDFTSATFITATGKQNTTGVFAEVNWAASSELDVSAALRHDAHNRFGGHTTGRLALAWRPQEDLIVRAALATGFRAPSLYELYAPIYGNDTLTPETSRSAELGIEKRLGGDDFVKATLFYTEVDDMIGSDAFFVYTQVPGTSVSKGIELSGRKALSDKVSLFGNYTYTESVDENDLRELRVPRHNLVLGLEAEIAPRWNVIGELQHVADTLDVDAQTFATIEGDDYTVVNAMVTYDVSDSAEAYFRIENIGDVEYQTVNGYGQSDRAFYLGLRAKF